MASMQLHEQFNSLVMIKNHFIPWTKCPKILPPLLTFTEMRYPSSFPLKVTGGLLYYFLPSSLNPQLNIECMETTSTYEGSFRIEEASSFDYKSG